MSGRQNERMKGYSCTLGNSLKMASGVQHISGKWKMRGKIGKAFQMKDKTVYSGPIEKGTQIT